MTNRDESHLVRAEVLLGHLRAWVDSREDIRALLLVGSFARGDARPDSDLDLVLLTRDPFYYVHDTTWVARFGTPESVSHEDYGRVTSVRVVYANRLEVEFAITDDRWASAPIDPGTAEVARNGIVVLLDRGTETAALVEAVAPHNSRLHPTLAAFARVKG